MSDVTLEKIYSEILNIKETLEEFMERSLINILPEEEIEEEEWEELQNIKHENEYISFDKIRKKND